MTESRAGHGCPTSYVNRLKHVIVAGEGYEYSKKLDSFETFKREEMDTSILKSIWCILLEEVIMKLL